MLCHIAIDIFFSLKKSCFNKGMIESDDIYGQGFKAKIKI